MGTDFQLCPVKSFVNMDGGNSYTLMYLMPLNFMPENGQDGKFHTMYILPEFIIKGKEKMEEKKTFLDKTWKNLLPANLYYKTY